MKAMWLLGTVLLFMTACGNGVKLEKEEAATIIREAKGYPRVFEYDVNVTDPQSARKLLNAGLENEGLVTIDKKQKMIDIGKPLVHFTEKAKPYLIRIDPKYDNVQVVKVADVDLKEIAGIQLLEDGKKAVVEYSVVYKNINTFSKLVDFDFSKPDTKRATLLLSDTGWKLQKSL